ncbi:hypothetical protein FisN_20Hu221 [Fistulifera solaris]|uniref:Uncharacterized protein n=1 Tax=Fistulifera solaris TaxID=1519565 RepID=A0A1Z5JQH6_FISSO|nr:hypothetical protein FisN_20Hu221 [Fistulifera solaris]|eukprot:GAX16102.1 hypothetical protein FisN_20Hu221 [Fistulifera solaris]
MNETNENDDILKLIPAEQLTTQQKLLLPTPLPLYEMLREPTHLDEIDWKKYKDAAIGRNNSTVILCSPYGLDKALEERKCAVFKISGRQLSLCCAIVGETDAAVAETATFFLSLKQDHRVYSMLEVGWFHDPPNVEFDKAVLSPEQLAQILDSNPTRELSLVTGTWTAEQSVVLASRPNPLNLKLEDGFRFADGGAAYVATLEKRQSSFGTLCITGITDGLPFTCGHLKRICNLNLLDVFGVECLDKECTRLLFAANVNALKLSTHAECCSPENFKALNIVPSDIDLDIRGGGEVPELLVSLFNRVAELGHFERLTLSNDKYSDSDPAEGQVVPFDDMRRVVNALIRAIEANCKLSYLDLSYSSWAFPWAEHFETIFRAMEEHKGLRTFVVQGRAKKGYTPNYPRQFDSLWLERLLSRNRNIEVLDCSQGLWSYGPGTDRLYLLNRFYRGASVSISEPFAVRPLLVAQAMVNSASDDFQLTALLLSTHVDVFCEWMQDVDFETSGAAVVVENGALSVSIPPVSCVLPRRRLAMMNDEAV